MGLTQYGSGAIVLYVVEVVADDVFIEWYQELSDADADAVTDAVNLLERVGVALGYPHSSQIKGSRYALRELRIQSQGRPLRVFYAFDPDRQGVLLLGGDKTGDDRFYEQMVPRAERVWEEYLSRTGHEEK
jgi:hypothetical protein